MIKAVIFDLDGTLVDTLEDLRNAVNLVLRAQGYAERSLPEIRSFVGDGLYKLMERSLPAGTDAEIVKAYCDEMTAYYKKHSLACTRPYDGIPELLQALARRGIVCAVATNKNENAAGALCRFFFGDAIHAVVGDNGVRPLKPDSACVTALLTALSLTKDEVFYCGDSETDARTACNAGVRGAGVLWGFREKLQLERAGFTLFAENPAELLRIIENAG